MQIFLSKKKQYWLDFMYAMTEREVKARYKHAVLGFLWIILNPILQMMIIGLIFQFFVPIKTENYFLFLFVGLLPWNFFAYTLSKATMAIIYERSLIQKAKFPREALVLSIVFSNAFHLLISWGMLLIYSFVLWLFGSFVLPSWWFFGMRLLALIFAFCWLVFFVSGVSLLTAALNAKYRDVNFMVQAVLPLWFYATPVIYALDLLPSRVAIFSYINPLTGILEVFHWVFLAKEILYLEGVSISVLVSLLLGTFGIWYFMQESASFDDWL